MNQFLDYKYYLHTHPNPDFRFTTITAGIILGLILLGIIWGYYRKKVMKDKVARKILRPYPGKLINYGLMFGVLLLVREAGIPYFSMRLWWVILIVIFLYQMIKLAVTYSSEYEKRTKQAPKGVPVDKYMPKKKK